MPAAIPIAASVAGSVVSSAMAPKGHASSSRTVPQPYEDHKSSTTKTSDTLQAWGKAQPLLDTILRDAGNLYSGNTGYINAEQAGYTPEMQNAIKQGSTSPWQAQSQENALSGVQGQQAITAQNVSQYAGKLGNSDLINDQMKGLELNAKRRLTEDLLPNIRGNFDSQGMYNSGLAKDAERRAVRDMGEGLSASEAGLRSQMYNTNVGIANQNLIGNRQFQSQSGESLANLGQQAFNNLQGTSNVTQQYAQNTADINRQNLQGEQQTPWDNLNKLYQFAAPLGQTFGSNSQTSNFKGDAEGVGSGSVSYGATPGRPSTGASLANGLMQGLQAPYNNSAGQATNALTELGTSAWNAMAGGPSTTPQNNTAANFIARSNQGMYA